MSDDRTRRLERYAAFATVPTIGVMGAHLCAGGGGGSEDFYHYGGPAIVIERTNQLSWTQTTGSFSGSSYSAQKAFGGVKLPDTDDQVKAFNGALSTTKADGRSDIGRVAKIKSNDIDFGWTRLADGQQIDSNVNFSGSIGVLSARITEFSKSGTFSTTIGDWAVDSSGEEVRGFMAFAGPSGDESYEGFGWVDIGWDGDVLTIYDYAVNFEGTIRAGQTSLAAVPGAGGLAALAMGAAGLRRRRKQTA
jgi:MYXO-CTERM domain-containing protein